MEQMELINEAARLINKASARQGAGFAVEARAHLEELRELLNLEHADTAAAKEKAGLEAQPAEE